MIKCVNVKIAMKIKKRSDKDGMGSRAYIQTPATDELKERFYAACDKTAMNGAAVGRELFLAFVEQIERGERLVPPFEIKEKPNAKK